MNLDSGICTSYTLTNTAESGLMPAMKLVKNAEHYYLDRMVTYSRAYAALGANQNIDRLIRIHFDASIVSGMYIILEDGNQYRIEQVQAFYDEDGLKVLELTLARIGELYDVIPE